MDFDKLVKHDSVYNKRIYFKNNPEELYLISFGGIPIIADVYNPKIRAKYWVADRKFVSKAEEARIKKRFKEEILDKVESRAKQGGFLIL